MSVSTVEICSVNSKLARLRWQKFQKPFLKAVVCNANLKLPYKPGIPSPEVLTIIPIAMFFTKNEIMPGRLVKAVSEKIIRCCYSSHSSADKIIDFLSSLQFKSITPFVCPDNDTPLDFVKAFILITLKHQNSKTSHDQTHQTTTSTIVRHKDNKDALSNVEFSRERIQKEQKN